MAVGDWKTYLETVRNDPTPERLRISLQWAVMTVHSMVTISEREFEAYHLRGELPKSLPTRRHRALADVEAFCDGLDFERFRRWSDERKINAIVRAVFGLGYAKAAFALTCAGLANVACIDIWIARARLNLERAPNWKDARRYLETVRRVYGRRSGDKQWADYERLNKAFRKSQHACVFRAMGVETYGQRTLI